MTKRERRQKERELERLHNEKNHKFDRIYELTQRHAPEEWLRRYEDEIDDIDRQIIVVSGELDER
jgi:hypothetical protein